MVATTVVAVSVGVARVAAVSFVVAVAVDFVVVRDNVMVLVADGAVALFDALLQLFSKFFPCLIATFPFSSSN